MLGLLGAGAHAGRLAVRFVRRPGPDALVHPGGGGPDRLDQPGRRERGVPAVGGQHALADHGRAGRRAVVHPQPGRRRPHAVAATPDGGCWATLWAASSVVRLDRDGGLAEEISFPPGSEPHGIALGPDGSVWVALETGSLAHLIP